jgi:transposase
MLRMPSLRELDRSSPQRVWLCAEFADMRRGFDSLAQSVREGFGRDPMSGDLFLFVGKGRDRLKALYWDTDGYALWYKRLEEGRLRLPRLPQGALSVELKASELAMLLEGIDLRSVKRGRRFERRPPVPGAVPGAGL